MSGTGAVLGSALRPLGALDASAAERLRREAADLPASGAIVVDLRGTRRIDAPGLGALVWLVGRQHAAGGQVSVLLAPDGPVRRLIALAGLHRLTTVVPEAG